MDKFNCYSHVEVRTGVNQLLTIAFPSRGDVNNKALIEKIRDFFKENIRSVSFPQTHKTNLEHGSYGCYSRYEIIQHKYAGGGHPGAGGIMEVLEIKNPPNGKAQFIIYERREEGWSINSWFSEWDTLEYALAAFKDNWYRNGEEIFSRLKGFKRLVSCGRFDPWFFAVGNEELMGDYCLPFGLEDDPVYKLGKQFVVFDDDEIPTIKICMGVRFCRDNDNLHGSNNCFRIIYWHDGSMTNERMICGKSKIFFFDGPEFLSIDFFKKFREFLSGRNTSFTVDFLDGNRFVGNLIKKDKMTSPEGEYLACVYLKYGKKFRKQRGTVNFKPTSETPNIIQYIKGKMTLRSGETIEKIKIERFKSKKGGQKWSGIFFKPLQRIE